MPADTRATSLFGLAALKSYLKATSVAYDAQIITIGDRISETVDSYCGRPIVSREIVEVRSGTNNQRLGLRYFPVSAVTEAKYRFTTLDQWVTIDVDTELELDGERGIAYLKQLVWPKGPQLVSITYTAGFGAKDSTDLPADIVGASLDWAKYVYDRWRADVVATGSPSLGGAAVQLVGRIPKDVLDTLDGYRPVRI